MKLAITEDEFRMIEFEASQLELMKLGNELRQDIASFLSLDGRVSSDAVVFQNDRYVLTLTSVQDGLRLDLSDDDRLEIFGSSKEVDWLALNFIDIAEMSIPQTPVDFHEHIEWFDGHEFLSEKSVPLVLIPSKES